MTNRVGIVGIDLKRLPEQEGAEALKSSGNNFGNMLFTNAAYKQILHSEHIGFSWDPDQVRQSFSSLFIPAANWINTTQDWGELADLIERTDLPCVVVGLGSQIQDINDVANVPLGTKKLLSVISERSSAIGVRGEFTAEVIRECGINNVEVLGCPSIFTYGTVPQIREFESISRIGIGPTRYVLNDINNSNKLDKQRQLYQFAIREASSIYFQSEQYEIDVISREGRLGKQNEMAQAYYGIYNLEELNNRLREKGRYHTSLSSWIADVKRDDIYIGTRIHGAIAATLAGTPAVLITHDKRTKELADTMCVPAISIEDFDIAMLFDIPNFIKQFDFEKFQRRSELNIKKLISFYKVNNLKNNLSI